VIRTGHRSNQKNIANNHNNYESNNERRMSLDEESASLLVDQYSY